QPRSLRLEPGTDRPEVLMAGVERGLLVSRFHYVNGMIDPPRAAMTGMTRDGTFLVERGEPVHAVQNLRFTDRILEALARADGIGDRLEPVPTWWSGGGVMLAPALRIRGFRFTGVAEKT
ncbi:MAG: metallopeptidase TldD-related protein, partial [Polyangiales bacterium]